MWLTLLNAILPGITGIIDKAVPDKAKAAEINSQISLALLSQSNTELEQRVKVILAEASGESWLQRNWRPLLMLTAILIVANNYILVPWVSAFGFVAPVLELSDRLWDLMNLGVGGYVVGRSAEKIADSVGPYLGRKK